MTTSDVYVVKFQRSGSDLTFALSPDQPDRLFSRGHLSIYFSLEPFTLRIRDARGYESRPFRIGSTDVYSLSAESVYTVSGDELYKSPFSPQASKRVKIDADDDEVPDSADPTSADPFAREAALKTYMLTGTYILQTL